MLPQFEEIISGLKSTDESERCYALEDLELIMAPEYIPLLVLGMEDNSVRVRETATTALIKVGGIEVAESVAKLLYSENVALRNAAIEILEELENYSLTVLEQYIVSDSADVRKFSLDIICKIIPNVDQATVKKIFTYLVPCLEDQDVNVAASAAEAIGLSKTELGISILLKYLIVPQKSTWLQCNIIVALARIDTDNSRLALSQIDKQELAPEALAYLEMALNGEEL
jgi:HEAT repeat protein